MNVQLAEVNYSQNTDELSAGSIQNLIREEAYRLFERRGRKPGHELDDWLQAERVINHHFGL